MRIPIQLTWRFRPICPTSVIFTAATGKNIRGGIAGAAFLAARSVQRAPDIRTSKGRVTKRNRLYGVYVIFAVSQLSLVPSGHRV